MGMKYAKEEMLPQSAVTGSRFGKSGEETVGKPLPVPWREGTQQTSAVMGRRSNDLMRGGGEANCIIRKCHLSAYSGSWTQIPALISCEAPDAEILFIFRSAAGEAGHG